MLAWQSLYQQVISAASEDTFLFVCIMCTYVQGCTSMLVWLEEAIRRPILSLPYCIEPGCLSDPRARLAASKLQQVVCVCSPQH